MWSGVFFSIVLEVLGTSQLAFVSLLVVNAFLFEQLCSQHIEGALCRAGGVKNVDCEVLSSDIMQDC